MAQVCKEIREWVEREVRVPIRTRREEQQRKCREKKCKWYCGCCNKWFCWFETVVYYVTEWIVMIVGEWITTFLCEAIIGIVNGLLILVNFVLEVIIRVFNLIDFVLTLFGIKIPKKIRIDVIILRDSPTTTVANIIDVENALQEATDIFKRELNVKVTSHNRVPISEEHEISPDHALNVSCGWGAFGENFTRTGNFFKNRVVGGFFGVTVFVVNDVKNDSGCSIGLIARYVTVQGSSLARRPETLAHEVGHACGLLHPYVFKKKDHDLMNRERTVPPYVLNRFQRAVFRSSRHVTYW